MRLRISPAALFVNVDGENPLRRDVQRG